MARPPEPPLRARLFPLGDRAVLVRFAPRLTDAGNRAAIGFARAVDNAPVPGVVEVAPNLVSVLLRYDPAATDYETLAGELRLRLAVFEPVAEVHGIAHEIDINYGGEAGPDFDEVCAALGKTPREFKDFHTGSAVRVLATGFAPGFIYLGLHGDEWSVPRRATVREQVPEGAVLFAAGQTAIAATPIRSGWPMIGRTAFRNFEVFHNPPAKLVPGDRVRFREARR